MLLALASANARAAQWFVQTDNVTFSPQFLTISAGDSVTFLNRGGYHNVVADDGSFRCAHGCDGDGKGGSGNARSSLWIVTRIFPTERSAILRPHGSPAAACSERSSAGTGGAGNARAGRQRPARSCLGAALVALAALRLR
jgi:hypothetical protein